MRIPGPRGGQLAARRSRSMPDMPAGGWRRRRTHAPARPRSSSASSRCRRRAACSPSRELRGHAPPLVGVALPRRGRCAGIGVAYGDAASKLEAFIGNFLPSTDRPSQRRPDRVSRLLARTLKRCAALVTCRGATLGVEVPDGEKV